MAGTEIGSDSVCKVEIENDCGDGALDMTKLDSGGDSVGSGEIVTYDRAIEFFQKGGKIVECEGLGAGDAEVEGVNKEEKIIKVNIVDFLAKLQINGVSQKPVNVRMEDGEVGENANLEDRVMDDDSESSIENDKFVELDAKLQKDNVELTDDEKESRTVLMDDLQNVSNPEDSEVQLAHEAIQQVTEATDDTVAKGDSESLTEKSKSAESDENLQTVEVIVEIVDDNPKDDDDVLSTKDDDDVLSTKADEAESASEVEQQLETEGTDDLMLKDVPESLIKESESVEIIDDGKESETVVTDDALNVSGPEDDEAESANEAEKQLETETTNVPKVEDDSGSLIENNEFVGLDEKLQNLEDTVEITDDNKETQTVLMDDVQNLSSSEDDEVKSVSELEQKLETEANSDLLVNDDSESQIENSESVEFDSKLQTVKEIDEIIDDKRSQDVVGENVQNALIQEDDEAQSVNEAEHSWETGSTDDEIVNESTVSQVSEISIDENQTEVQPNESVEIMEDCPATESVKAEHENEEVCLEKDRVSQVEEAQFEVKKSQDRPALIFPPSFACPEIKVQFGSYLPPIRDQPKLILPATCVMPEVYIEFGSFSSHKKAPNKLPDVSVTETETEPECGSENNISEIVTNDLQEENGEMPTCHEVDEIDEVQRAEEVPEGSESNNSEIILNDLKEENAEMPACHKSDEVDEVQKAEEVPEDSVSEAVDAQTVEAEVPLDNLLIEEHTSEDEKFTEEINNAQLQLDEKTRCRDAISSEIKMQKEIARAQNEACNAANLEVKSAKGLVKSKGQEIDYFQRLIKKTNPVEDIDSRICKLVHMKKHETPCLKDENQVIREIKQLKSIRKQLALNVGFQDETQQALYQKDQIQEHVKHLKKELKSLKDGVSKAEVAAKSIRDKYEVELEKGRGLRTQLKAANELRRGAYVRLVNLKNNQHDKAGDSVTIQDEENHSDDEFKEKVAGDNEQIMKNKEHAEPTEILENKKEEKFDEPIKEEIELKKQHQLEENMNANEAHTQAHKEAEKKEKARLKRLRQKERKRAGGDVAESKEIENTEENTQQLPQPHVLLKQLKRSIIPTHPAVAFATRSRKGLWKHSGKMVTAAVVLLSVISLGYTDYAKLVSSQ